MNAKQLIEMAMKMSEYNNERVTLLQKGLQDSIDSMNALNPIDRKDCGVALETIAGLLDYSPIPSSIAVTIAAYKIQIGMASESVVNTRN